MRLSLSLLALCSAFAGIASAQTLIRALYGENQIDRFGAAVANAGDVDGDGFDDLLISATLDDSAGPQYGRVGLYSGRSGELIRNHFGTSGDDQFGNAVSGMGDVDGDGTADVGIGMPWASDTGFRHGKVWVLSGASGALLHEVLGDSDNDYFGSSLCSLGDVNADGFDEFAVGAELDDPADVSGAGTAYVFDGQSGGILYTFHGAWDQGNLGTSMANAGDVDDDGVNDLVVGSPRDGVNGVYAGAATVYSGATGTQLFAFRGQAGNYFGTSVDGAGDVNGDGHADVLVGATDFPQGPGYAQVFSGANGLVLHTVLNPINQAALLFGISVAGLGDVDGDQHDDFAVGRSGFGEGYNVFSGATGLELHDVGFPTLALQGGVGGVLAGMGDVDGDSIPDVLTGAGVNNTFALNGGAAFVHSGAQLVLDADERAVSVTGGGTQTFEIDLGSAHGGEFYWLFGSISGVTPGLPLGANVLPLNFDTYFQATLLAPNTAPLTDSLGTLDVDGRATASFSIPAGSDPSLIGRVGHHALVSIALGPLTYTSVSNAYPTILAP